MTLYPRKLVTIRSGTANDDGSGTSSIVLDSGASAVDDFYNGMLCVANLDGTVEARIITDYVGSTKAATVVPDWTIAPDNSDTFTIYLVEGVQLNQANVTHYGGAAGTFSSGRPEVNTSHAAGTAWNSGAIGASTLASDTIAAAKIATGAITAAKFAAGAIDAAAIADNAIDAGALAADCITAAKIATGAIDADALAADFVDEIWDENMEGTHTARELLRLFAAALLGKASGLATTTAVFRDIDDTKDRITATVDADGNRSAVTLDET